MITEAHACAPGMAPDLCCYEQKTESCGRHSNVPQRLRGVGGFPIKKHKPGIKIVSQHRQLKVILVGHKKPGRMGRQAGIVVRFLDQVLSPGALIVKPHEPVDRLVHVGDEDSILVLLGFKELILHDLIRFLSIIRNFLIARPMNLYGLLHPFG